MKKRKPFALIVDDSSEFNSLFIRQLGSLGIEAEAVTTPKSFNEKLKQKKPDLGFIDLNLMGSVSGFELVKSTRAAFPNLPLFVVSSQADLGHVSHALEIGANDFIVKPVEVDSLLLGSKLSGYVSTAEVLSNQFALLEVPDGGVPAQVGIGFQIQEVDELGIKICGKHLLLRGAVVYLSGPGLGEITGVTDKPLLLTVTSASVSADGKSYMAYAEFDSDDRDLLTAVRRWLAMKIDANA